MLRLVKNTTNAVVNFVKFFAENGEQIKSVNKELYDISVKMNNAQTHLAKALISVIDGKHIQEIRDALTESVNISNKMSQQMMTAIMSDWVYEDEDEETVETAEATKSTETAESGEATKSRLRSTFKMKQSAYDITDGLDDLRQRDMNNLVDYIRWVASTYDVKLNDPMLTNVDIVRAGRYVANACGNDVVKNGLNSKILHFSNAFKNVVVSRNT